jgi:hypothetical protein
MTSKHTIKNAVITIVGGVFLLGLPIISWLPRNCPILLRYTEGCAKPYASEPTRQERELSRIAHKEVDSESAQFSVNAQGYRAQTTLDFMYHADLTKEVDYLQVRTDSGYRDLALITDPLLASLTWASASENPYRLYARTTAPSTPIADFVKTAPANLAADRVAAANYHLPDGSYRPLDSLTSLDGIDYVLTSYSPGEPDGSWRSFHATYDLTDVKVDDGKVAWLLRRETQGSDPFLLGTVHVDYHLINPPAVQ